MSVQTVKPYHAGPKDLVHCQFAGDQLTPEASDAFVKAGHSHVDDGILVYAIKKRREVGRGEIIYLGEAVGSSPCT